MQTRLKTASAKALGTSEPCDLGLVSDFELRVSDSGTSIPSKPAQNRIPLATALALLLLLATLPVSVARAQLQILPEDGPRRVFGGADQSLRLLVRNPSNQPVRASFRLRLYQTSSATALPLEERPWKALEVLPGQTVLETATLALPPVKAETRLVVKWLSATNQVAGTTEILVYPTNLLQGLKALGGEPPLGVLDPQGELKPLLKAAAVDYLDLEDTALESFAGKLAIIGPFQNPAQMHEDLSPRLKILAQKGVAVVWLLPRLQPPQPRHALTPSFYTVIEGPGAIVVAQAHLVASLAENPEAQLHLLELARLALHPLPAQLPQPTSSP
jgi:hypothetical protein